MEAQQTCSKEERYHSITVERYYSSILEGKNGSIQPQQNRRTLEKKNGTIVEWKRSNGDTNMRDSTHTALAQVARAYVSDQLYLDRRAGAAIGDEFWIAVAGQLVRSSQRSRARRRSYNRLSAVK